MVQFFTPDDFDENKVNKHYSKSVQEYVLRSIKPKNGIFDDKFTFGHQMPEDQVKHVVIGEH